MATLSEIIESYGKAAEIERIKIGRPTPATVRNTRLAVEAFIKWRASKNPTASVEDNESSLIVQREINSYLVDMLQKGLKPITAISKISHLRQLFARWTRPYYEMEGLQFTTFPSVGRTLRPSRYTRPDRVVMKALKDFYESLENRLRSDETFPGRRTNVPIKEIWFAMTMMLEFAVRNNDIMRLTNENFIQYDGMPFLRYQPHKTKNSSGRVVLWPVHEAIWSKIAIDRPRITDETFIAVNKIMRSLGFKGSKGAYELRKICIDHVYQRFGAERAVSISGDDIRTIIYYYADPSRPNIGDVRVLDLICQ